MFFDGLQEAGKSDLRVAWAVSNGWSWDLITGGPLQVVLSPPKPGRPYRCTISRRDSLDVAAAALQAQGLLAAEP